MDTHVWVPKPGTAAGVEIDASASSAAITPGVNTLVFITCPSAYHIKFGNATLTAATASDFYIPAAVVPDAWELTDQCTSFRIFNPNLAAITIYYTLIGKR